jgi:fluoride exporter
MNQLLAIAAGGAAGSVLRYWLAQAVQTSSARGFPFGTVTVNVIGCLLIGWLYVLLARDANETLRAGVLIGILGGFTTFSAFSLETFLLIEHAEWLKAVANVLVSVTLCIAATALGIYIGKLW